MSRITTLYHGTTAHSAENVVLLQEFSPVQTFFALGDSNRDLAELFARRSALKRPRQGGPALVVVRMEEEAFERLRKLGLMRPRSFDAEDRPELRNRTQWVLDAAGVPFLNRDMDEAEWTAL